MIRSCEVGIIKLALQEVKVIQKKAPARGTSKAGNRDHWNEEMSKSGGGLCKA